MLRGVVMRRDVPVLSDPAVGLRPAPARGNDVSNPYVARHTFTKLVVGDLEGMARYYASVFGLTEIARVQAEVDGAPIDEIILGFEGAFAGGLILFTFVGRPAPQPGEVIVGFTTDDIHALFDRAVAAGATIREHIREPGAPGAELVGFLADPEGHLAEIVQT
jgi:catechol 2,3-dioxygenase-like lactoylglutathione lyase family enzyme